MAIQAVNLYGGDRLSTTDLYQLRDKLRLQLQLFERGFLQRRTTASDLYVLRAELQARLRQSDQEDQRLWGTPKKSQPDLFVLRSQLRSKLSYDVGDNAMDLNEVKRYLSSSEEEDNRTAPYIDDSGGVGVESSKDSDELHGFRSGSHQLVRIEAGSADLGQVDSDPKVLGYHKDGLGHGEENHPFERLVVRDEGNRNLDQPDRLPNTGDGRISAGSSDLSWINTNLADLDQLKAGHGRERLDRQYGGEVDRDWSQTKAGVNQGWFDQDFANPNERYRRGDVTQGGRRADRRWPSCERFWRCGDGYGGRWNDLGWGSRDREECGLEGLGFDQGDRGLGRERGGDEGDELRYTRRIAEEERRVGAEEHGGRDVGGHECRWLLDVPEQISQHVLEADLVKGKNPRAEFMQQMDMGWKGRNNLLNEPKGPITQRWSQGPNTQFNLATTYQTPLLWNLTTMLSGRKGDLKRKSPFKRLNDGVDLFFKSVAGLVAPKIKELHGQINQQDVDCGASQKFISRSEFNDLGRKWSHSSAIT